MPAVNSPKLGKIENSVGFIVVHECERKNESTLTITERFAKKDMVDNLEVDQDRIFYFKVKNRKGGVEEIERLISQMEEKIAEIKQANSENSISHVFVYSEFNVGYSQSNTLSALCFKNALHGKGFSASLHGFPGSGGTDNPHQGLSEDEKVEREKKEKKLGVKHDVSAEDAQKELKNSFSKSWKLKFVSPELPRRTLSSASSNASPVQPARIHLPAVTSSTPTLGKDFSPILSAKLRTRRLPSSSPAEIARAFAASSPTLSKTAVTKASLISPLQLQRNIQQPQPASLQADSAQPVDRTLPSLVDPSPLAITPQFS